MVALLFDSPRSIEKNATNQRDIYLMENPFDSQTKDI